MTQKEYIATGTLRARKEAGQYTLKNNHYQSVKNAIVDGESVPPEVLADYPNLPRQFKAEDADRDILIDIKPYHPRPDSQPNQYLMEAHTSSGEIAGSLGYEEHPEYIHIRYIEVSELYRGKRYSDAMMNKLFEVAGGRAVLSGQINRRSYDMFRRMEREGILKLKEPRNEYRDIATWELCRK